MLTPARLARNPSSSAISRSRSDCTSRTSVSLSARPSSSATRLTGVTRSRSMMPNRSSLIKPMPANALPNNTISTSTPGVK